MPCPARCDFCETMCASQPVLGKTSCCTMWPVGTVPATSPRCTRRTRPRPPRPPSPSPLPRPPSCHLGLGNHLLLDGGGAGRRHHHHVIVVTCAAARHDDHVPASGARARAHHHHIVIVVVLGCRWRRRRLGGGRGRRCLGWGWLRAGARGSCCSGRACRGLLCLIGNPGFGDRGPCSGGSGGHHGGLCRHRQAARPALLRPSSLPLGIAWAPRHGGVCRSVGSSGGGCGLLHGDVGVRLLGCAGRVAAGSATARAGDGRRQLSSRL